mmetsp:Transcript_18619/g.26750  ORF Transcript_18619/g.26750 Transcript_18619/m.26750 type:complete len:96 (+) Transcript_18619:978-1265(+)
MLFRIVEKVQKRAPTTSGGGRELKDFKAKKYEKKKESVVITPPMIAINYIVAKGGVPLVDVYDTETAKQLLGCLGWSLTDEEIIQLEQAAELSAM